MAQLRICSNIEESAAAVNWFSESEPVAAHCDFPTDTRSLQK
ncbi:MAG: hypothetical protein R2873_32095 [Caldilineaceae bacterium]